MRRLSIFAIFLCLYSGGALGQVEGRLIIDRADIYCSMPVSGVVELTPQSDVIFLAWAERALSFISGGTYVKIGEPNGNELLIDKKTILGDLHVNSWPIPRKGILKAGTTYAIPVFLLKTSDRFIFDEPGEYQVSFAFPSLPGEPEFNALVNVQENDSCGRSLFEELFQADHALVCCFAGGFSSAASVPDSSFGDYSAAYAIAMANQYGGPVVAPLMFRRDLTELRDDGWCLKKKTEETVRTGLKWDAIVSGSRGIWPVVSEKLNLLQKGIFDTPIEKVDTMGRVIILPY